LADPAAGADPRAFAWHALERIEAGEFSDAVVGKGLAGSRLAGRDRALATRLVYGTLAWQGYLDHVLAAFSSRPIAAIDPPVRTLLRLALFQICRLDRVPTFAAVNTAVSLCKHRHQRSAGFVNALLRRASTAWQDVPIPAAATDLAGHLAIRLSHPRWLVERWLLTYGADDTEALLAANNEVAPTIVRVNRLHGDRDALLSRWQAAGVSAATTPFSKLGIHLDGEADAERLPGYAEGHFAFQGEASQLVGELVGAIPGEHVLDLCAAPGGKACQLAETMENRGRVTAIDISPGGIERLRREALRLGVTNIDAVVADAATWQPADGTVYDRVLVDAPCTGFGTLRQHPEIRWRRSDADVARNAELQAQLLRRAALHVRPGGTVVYATCTLGREENEDVVRAVCADGLLQIAQIAPQQGECPSHMALVADDGCLRTFPHRHGLDGFFAARLLRSGTVGTLRR